MASPPPESPRLCLAELADDLLFRIAGTLDARSLGVVSTASRALGECVTRHRGAIARARRCRPDAPLSALARAERAIFYEGFHYNDNNDNNDNNSNGGDGDGDDAWRARWRDGPSRPRAGQRPFYEVRRRVVSRTMAAREDARERRRSARGRRGSQTPPNCDDQTVGSTPGTHSTI